jgi:hypothetical protein
MRMSKVGALLASLTITTGTAAVLAAGPAQAADNATQSSLTLGVHSDGVAALYHSYLGTFSGMVTYDDSTVGTTPVTAGAADLQQKLPGHNWKTVRTDSNASDGVSFGNYGSTAKQNVKYRIHYLGGTDPVTTTTTYAESYSNTVTVRTAWDLKPHALCTHKCRFYGKLAPKAKHHKVLIQVKHHGWKRYKVVRTNKHSHWTAFVKPKRGNGALYRAVVAGNKHLIKNYALGRFTIIGKSSFAISRR